jgi:hypothetical protein
MEAYRVYTQQNSADTWRDADDIIIKELCYKKSRESAKKFMMDYIKENFFNKEVKIYERKTIMTATNVVSYGETIVAKRVIIED